jgi:predicted esterase
MPCYPWAFQVVVAGFSQGGAVSLLMLRSNLKLGGVIGEKAFEPVRFTNSQMRVTLYATRLSTPHVPLHCSGLSSWLPLRNATPVVSEANAKTPVFMGHGNADPVVSTLEVYAPLTSQIYPTKTLGVTLLPDVAAVLADIGGGVG